MTGIRTVLSNVGLKSDLSVTSHGGFNTACSSCVIAHLPSDWLRHGVNLGGCLPKGVNFVFQMGSNEAASVHNRECYCANACMALALLHCKGVVVQAMLLLFWHNFHSASNLIGAPGFVIA